MDFRNKFDHREPAYRPTQPVLLNTLESLGFTGIRDLQPLMGGYSNLNYKVTRAGAAPVVLRLCAKSRREFQSEISVLERLANVIPVPRILASQVDHSLCQRHVAILDFAPGHLLSAVEDTLSAHEIEQIAAQLGAAMAKIHGIKFGAAGFLGTGLRVCEPFSSFYDGYFKHMRTCVEHPLLVQRLEPDFLRDIRKFIDDHEQTVVGLRQVSRLTHADFNQKNILVDNDSGKWRITAILDWEFAFSGAPLMDFGNFFRFETEISPHYEIPLIDAYRDHNGCLSDTWRRDAKVLDLLSLLEFLTREGDHPKTFATAQKVIHTTLYGGQAA